MNIGAMDRSIIGGMINNICRFIHFVACQKGSITNLKDIRNIIGMLKILRPVLDEALESQIPLDEQLIKAFEELDITVDEARDFMEKRPTKMSSICNVLQSEPMVLKVQRSSIEICHVLSKLLQSGPLFSCSASLQEIRCFELDLISELIEVALKDQRKGIIPSLEDVIKITETLGLRSNRELLVESIALEKERTREKLRENFDTDHLDEIISLVTHMRYCIAKLEQLGVKNGLPIPSYFRCPLSLELMLDPVILDSGQTYERSFIQKWLDSGLRICPKTRKTLDHTNLISNHTVKAMIASWCEENNNGLCKSVQPQNIPNHILPRVAQEDIISTRSSFYDSVHRKSTSRSSIEYVNQPELLKSEVSSRCGGEKIFIVGHDQTLPYRDIAQGTIPLGQESCCYSSSESTSSSISSIGISGKFEDKVSLSDVTNPSSTSSKDLGYSSPLPNQNCSSADPLNSYIRSHSLATDTGTDNLTTTCHVQKLIKDLTNHSAEDQIVAATELRLLAKHNMENRALIGKSGAIDPLVSLLYSKVNKIQETAVTALLNLSIYENNKIAIAEAGVIEPLIHVLEFGSTEAQENSAATLYSISLLEEYKMKIGSSGAVKALVGLLGYGSLRGKKDAATALFNLSILHDNKARIVQAGAVKYLVELLDPSTDMVDKSVALLANLSTIPEGRYAITHEGGIPLLVEIVEMGSQRGKENAVFSLLQLCIDSQKFCNLVLEEGVVPPLIALSQFGTPRAKQKAQQILSHFRSQREVAGRKAKS